MDYLKIIVAVWLCAACSGKAVDHEDYAQWVNRFGVELLKDVAHESTEANVVVAPFSAYIALAMAASGASGHTYDQIHDALHFSNLADVQRGSHELLEESDTTDVTYSAVSRIFSTEDIHFKDEFERKMKDMFHSSVSKLNSKDRGASLKSINDWSSESTHGRIPMIVHEDDIKNLDTFMMLLNVVYFKGDWKVGFDKEGTKDDKFMSSTEKTAKMMRLEHEFYWGELKNLRAKFIELPYKNDDYRMTVIVPKEGTVDDLLKNFTPHVFYDMKESRKVEKLELYMPKFKLDFSESLNQPFIRMGMTDMFDEKSADFSNMTMTSSKKIKVKEVKQKVFMEVNEEGTEAAAETDFVLAAGRALESVKTFKVDRPSIFLITKKDTVLFMGYFKDPVY